MIKTYVLDTNVLLQDPLALYQFEDNEIVLSIAVLEELDRLKTSAGERGQNARQAIRELEALRQRGNLTEGVPLTKNGGSLKLQTNCSQVKLPDGFAPGQNDNRILQVTKALYEQSRSNQKSEHQSREKPEKTGQVVLVTQDILLRIKAQIIGIPAEEYQTDQVTRLDDQYTGRTEVFVASARLRHPWSQH